MSADRQGLFAMSAADAERLMEWFDNAAVAGCGMKRADIALMSRLSTWTSRQRASAVTS